MTSKKHADRVVTHLYQFQDFLRISSSIYSTFALDIVLDTVLKQVLTLTNAYRAILFLRDPEQKSLHIEATRTKDGQHMSADEMPYNREIVEQVFNSKQPIMMDARQQEANLPFHAIICVSLMLHGEAIGVLYADSKFDNANLNKDLIPLLIIFANQVAVAIDNARSIEKQRNEARLEHEIKIAEEIQHDFLPSAIPFVQGWLIEPFFLPAREVAGDFYDAFLLDEYRMAFIIGDVCDKGLGAALFMSLFRSLLRAYTEQQSFVNYDSVDLHHAELSKLLQTSVLSTNNYIAINHGLSNMFATIFMGIIEPQSNGLIYINAGHNPPYVMNAQGEVKHTLPTNGPAVGMFPDMTFNVASVDIEKGDFIVCYTDGLTEAKNNAGSFFGEERLIDLFAHQPPTSARDAVARIRSSVQAYVADAPQFDDITLLVIQHADE
ncbi:MAG: SpoIIE family protein phosphatase, partial [Chloroflexota bacterium]